MIIPDFEIARLCKAGMVTPFDPDLVGAASLDIRLGDTLLMESVSSPEAWCPYSLKQHSQEKPYLMKPGQFLLADSLEVFNIPTHLAPVFILKSSRARERYDHAKAGFCDPGWHNSRLTMELKNNSQIWCIPLWPGMKIGQMVFHQMAATPHRSYAVRGRYNNDTTVQESKG